MDGSIVQLISSVGFPIVCCCAMAWYINNTVKELSQTIANNNLVLEKLAAILSQKEDN